MKPRVFMAMASGILGGPGKGLAQFFRHGGLEGCEPVVAAYNRRADGAETEFIREMRATGAPVTVLRQQGRFDRTLVDQAHIVTQRCGSEILQSHGYKSHVLCWLLRARTKLPWVAFVHGWTAEDFTIRMYNGLEHMMLLFADEVVAVSESVRERLLPTVRKRCIVIPNAVAEEELYGNEPSETNRAVKEQLGLDPDLPVVGVVGRLSPEKGHNILLLSLAEAQARGISLQCLIVGDGPERGNLEAQAQALGLSPRCVFVGHVRGLARYYRVMDILALPSFSEGMPNAALEGMIMGLPVVASAVGGVPEVVKEGETGLLVAAKDVSALTSAIVRLAASPEERSRMGAAGRERAAARHSPEIRVRKFFDLYAKMLSR